MSEMKKIFKEIARLDPVFINNAQRSSKLFEECGELAQAINKTIGMKTTSQSREEVEAEILEESADVIQNVFSILSQYGFSLSDLEKELDKKNKVWKNKIKTNIKITKKRK